MRDGTRASYPPRWPEHANKSDPAFGKGPDSFIAAWLNYRSGWKRCHASSRPCCYLPPSPFGALVSLLVNLVGSLCHTTSPSHCNLQTNRRAGGQGSFGATFWVLYLPGSSKSPSNQILMLTCRAALSSARSVIRGRQGVVGARQNSFSIQSLFACSLSNPKSAAATLGGPAAHSQHSAVSDTRLAVEPIDARKHGGCLPAAALGAPTAQLDTAGAGVRVLPDLPCQACITSTLHPSNQAHCRQPLSCGRNPGLHPGIAAIAATNLKPTHIITTTDTQCACYCHTAPITVWYERSGHKISGPGQCGCRL